MRTVSTRRALALLVLFLTCGAFLWGTLHGADQAAPAKPTPDEPEPQQASPQARQRGSVDGRGVYKTQITPHWFHDNTRFWYRNDLRGGAREFIVADAEHGLREAAFDHQKLAAALSKAADTDYKADKLPFDSIEFVEDAKAVRFKVGNTTWKCDLTSYQCSKTEPGPDPDPSDVPSPDSGPTPAELDRQESLWPDGLAPDPEQPAAEPQRPRQPEASGRSPDGKWTAFVKEYNVYVRSADGKEVPLSQDGKSDLAYGMLSWTPDSKTLVAFRIEPGERKEVYLIESSPPGGGRAKLRTRPYDLPGDKFTAYELNLFDVDNQKQTKPEVDRTDFGRPSLRWRRDGHTFTYEKRDRGHQRFRLIEVDTHTGKVRNLIDEKTETFIWSAHTESLRGLQAVRWLEKTDEITTPPSATAGGTCTCSTPGTARSRT
jgi:hypothetical protein